MQHLVCWTLMGMRTTGGREVWYQLGSFDSESRAAEAAASSYWSSQGLQNVSVVPYYRVDSVSPSRAVESVENASRSARTAEGKVTHTAV
jgi:hypothetical protein